MDEMPEYENPLKQVQEALEAASVCLDVLNEDENKAANMVAEALHILNGKVLVNEERLNKILDMIAQIGYPACDNNCPVPSIDCTANKMCEDIVSAYLQGSE